MPYLEDGTPFPTQLYLTCPSAVSELGRLEAQHGVAEFRRLIRDEPQLRYALLDLRERYRRRRRRLLESGVAASSTTDGGAVLEAGIGGPKEPGQATCLHANAAAILVALEGPPQILRADEPPASVQAAWRALLARFGNLWCPNGWCRAFLRGERRAAIDVGTNSVRLLVADHFPGFGPRTLLRQAEVTQLGAGVARAGRLSEAGRRRTTAAVEAYAREARSMGAGRIVLVATSAARDALDGPEYIRELGHSFGLHALVAPGNLEARLSYSGATLDVPQDPVFVDPGGGSTELVRRRPDGELLTVSLDIGAVRATDRWISHDPPLAEERISVKNEAAKAFLPLVPVFGRQPGQPGSQLVGVAGTVTTLACQILRLEEYDSDAVHLTRVTYQALVDQADRLAALTNDQRSCLSCMQRGRERVIVAGADIVAAAMEVFGYDCLLVSERDMLDGIIMAAEELIEGYSSLPS